MLLHSFIAIVLGLLSGCISYLLTRPDILPSKDTWTLVPGIVFGIAIILYFILTGQKNNPLKIIGFLFLSTGAYFIAVWTTIIIALKLSPPLFSNVPANTHSFGEPLAIIIGGCVGALVLFSGIRTLLKKVSLSYLFPFIICSGILSLSFYIPVLKSQSTDVIMAQLPGLFIVWQTGMLFITNLILKKENI